MHQCIPPELSRPAMPLRLPLQMQAAISSGLQLWHSSVTSITIPRIAWKATINFIMEIANRQHLASKFSCVNTHHKASRKEHCHAAHQQHQKDGSQKVQDQSIPWYEPSEGSWRARCRMTVITEAFGITSSIMRLSWL